MREMLHRFVIFLHLNVIRSTWQSSCSFLKTCQSTQYSVVVGNGCVFPLMVIFLSVHSCTARITGSAWGFAGLSVMVFVDVSTLALTTGCS